MLIILTILLLCFCGFNVFVQSHVEAVRCRDMSSRDRLYKCAAVAEMGDRLATIDMGQKLGGSAPFLERGAGSLSNTMWPGPRPTCKPSFILIRPTVWPQHTNVTDRQPEQDRQTEETDNGLIAYGEPFYKRSPKNGSPYAIGPLSHFSLLSVCNACVLWSVGWMDQDAIWFGGRPRPKPHCLRWDPATPFRGGPQFWGREYISATV